MCGDGAAAVQGFLSSLGRSSSALKWVDSARSFAMTSVSRRLWVTEYSRCTYICKGDKSDIRAHVAKFCDYLMPLS